MERSLRLCSGMALAVTLCLALAAPATPILAQDGKYPKPGTRMYKTRQVDWSAVREAEAAPPQAKPVPLGQFDPGELDKIQVPILLPDDEQMIEHMWLFAKPDFYAAAFKEQDTSLQITGTRVDQGRLETHSARSRMEHGKSNKGHFYQRTEYGVELSFVRYNVSYNISVECREPATDLHCKDDIFVTELAERLVYVGGAPKGDQP